MAAGGEGARALGPEAPPEGPKMPEVGVGEKPGMCEAGGHSGHFVQSSNQAVSALRPHPLGLRKFLEALNLASLLG